MVKLFRWKVDYRKSYSQTGEDVIADFIFRAVRIKKISYLDIGAHDPARGSNTYYFYKKGCRGVNIEPNPFLFKRLASKRRRDINLNAGVAAKEGVLDFYFLASGIKDADTLNTFSKKTAERYESYGNKKVKEVLKIKVLNINNIMREYFNPKPNFVSLDVEGMEVEILESFDFLNFQPEVFCIETIVYAEDNSEFKETKIIDFMKSKGYMVFADTYINTIFVDERVWRGRPLR